MSTNRYQTQTNKILSQLGILLLLGCPLFWHMPTVYAHGGGDIYLSKVPVGVCEMTVWVAPAGIIRPSDDIHVTVALQENETFILEEDVWLIVEQEGEVVLETAVSPDNADLKLYYEIDFKLNTADTYDFTVQTRGQTCKGEASLLVTLENNQNTVWYASLPTIIFLAGIIYLWQKRSSDVSKLPPKPTTKQ